MSRLLHAVNVARHRLATTPFAVVIALLGVNSAVLLFVQPGRVPTHNLLRPYDYVWAVFYGCGGLLILAGIASARANIEAAGCIAFAGGSIISAFAWAVIGRWHAWNQILVLGVFTVAAGIRTLHIVQGRVLILVEISPRPDEIAKVVDNGAR